MLTLEKLFERQYVIPEPQTSQEIIAYYAELIAGDIKLPGQFAVLAPKIRDFLKYRAFGHEIDLDTVEARRAINRSLTRHITQTEFLKILRAQIIEEQTPVLETEERRLADVKPFAWSQETVDSPKCIFSKVPVDNKFEAEFARFLDKAQDVARFTKLPLNIGFSIPYTDSIGNLRQYYPDFLVVDTLGGHWLVETKGMEDIEVASKDRAAAYWADNATRLTGTPWGYIKVRQRDFSRSAPFQRAGAIRQRLAQRARQVARHDIGAGFILPVIVEWEDMGMLEPANAQGFGVEARHEGRLVRLFGADELHQDGPLHRGLPGAIDRAGRAHAHGFAQLVALDDASWGRGGVVHPATPDRGWVLCLL